MPVTEFQHELFRIPNCLHIINKGTRIDDTGIIILMITVNIGFFPENSFCKCVSTH